MLLAFGTGVTQMRILSKNKVIFYIFPSVKIVDGVGEKSKYIFYTWPRAKLLKYL